MKRLISVLLVAALLVSSCFALAGCNQNQGDDVVSEADVVDNGVYTLNYAMSTFPTNWNPHTYQTDTDSEIIDYITRGFYTFDYNDAQDSYAVVPDMAIGEPVDVTADYVGKFGIEEGDEAKAYKITLREDIKWQDGTPITAADFVTSAQLLLNPAAANYRADSLYSGNMVIVNAQKYSTNGLTVSYQENNTNSVVYTMADLTLGEDGKYVTPQGNVVYIAVGAPLNDWLGGNSLADYVGAYGETYFDVASFEALYALANEDGYAELTEETYGLLVNVITFSAGWGESADNVPDYLAYDFVNDTMSWDEVGLIATGDYELTIVLEKQLSGFYLLYSLTGSWLVNEPLYTSLEKVDGAAYTNTYGTSAETTISYGPYKLDSFQSDKIFTLSKNDNWYGYNDEENKGLYQTTNIQYDYVPEASTRLEMFINGKLDSYGLTADDMEDYSKSDYCYYTPGDSTFAMVFNPDLDALTTMQEAAGENINKTIITVPEFRMAMSFALDRAAFCLATSPTNGPAYAIYSELIVSDPDSATFYRSTEQAKNVLVDFWGLTDDIGAGKTYETIDDAIDSITGYNLTKAQQYFDLAYDKAIADGLMDEDDVVEIKIGLPNGTSSFYANGYEFMVNNYTEAVKGTKLEGKLTFTRDDTLGNGFSDALKANNVDMLFGVGWTGSTLDPYGLMEAYTDSNYQYDPAWNTSVDQLTIEINGKAYTASVRDWNYAMTGDTIQIVDENGQSWGYSCGEAANDPETRLEILAALEGAVLSRYDFIPIMDASSAGLKGAQVNYYTEDYIFGMGRGGIKYMTFNYNDAEWDEFVASQGGTLNYK